MASASRPQSISAASCTLRLCRVNICSVVMFSFCSGRASLSDSSSHSLSSSSSSSVSSAVGGPGLSPCQHHRFLGGVRAPRPDEAVQTARGGAGLLQIAGDSLGSRWCRVLTENIATGSLGFRSSISPTSTRKRFQFPEPIRFLLASAAKEMRVDAAVVEVFISTGWHFHIERGKKEHGGQSFFCFTAEFSLTPQRIAARGHMQEALSPD